MSNALVVRTQRHKKIGDAASPMVFTLKRKSKDAKIFDLERIAQDIEALGGMSARTWYTSVKPLCARCAR